MAFKHSQSTKIHILHAFTYATQAARLAATGFTSSDIGKRAYQTDNKTFWDIKDVISGNPVWIDAGFNPSGTTNQLIQGDGAYINKADLPISTATQDALDLKLDSSAYIQHFKGVYTTLGALTTAHPTAIAGDYAQVDPGTGTNLETYSYDLQEGWILSNAPGSGAANTDALPEGSTNLYFTVARVRSTLLTGLSLATSQVIAATDTILQALGYLQAQITNLTDVALTATSTNTISNKRIAYRVVTISSSATPTINTDITDIFRITAQAVNITSFTTNLSGTPTEGDLLQILITGTAARTITWGTSFASSTVQLPTTTVSTNTLRVTLQWDSNVSKWVCVGAV